jgi:hypothetical protein
MAADCPARTSQSFKIRLRSLSMNSQKISCSDLFALILVHHCLALMAIVSDDLASFSKAIAQGCAATHTSAVTWSRCDRRRFLRTIRRRHGGQEGGEVVISRLNIILVHGTWGRGFFREATVADWCKPDSNFVRRLTYECLRRMPSITPSITAFNWSGRNSVFERAKAATDTGAVENKL